MDAQESLATSTLKTQLDEVLALQGLNNSGNVNIAANIVGVGSTLISFDEASLLPMQEVEFIDTQQVSQVTSVMTAEVNSVIQSNQDIIDSTQQQILSQAQTNSAMDKKDALELIQQNIQQANNKAPDGNSIHNEKQNKLKAQNKNLP
jgi:hypothetical protein